MTELEIGGLLIGALVVLVLLGVHIAVALIGIGFGGCVGRGWLGRLGDRGLCDGRQQVEVDVGEQRNLERGL